MGKYVNKCITITEKMPDGIELPRAIFTMFSNSDEDIADRVKGVIKAQELFGKHLLVNVEDI